MILELVGRLGRRTGVPPKAVPGELLLARSPLGVALVPAQLLSNQQPVPLLASLHQWYYSSGEAATAQVGGEWRGKCRGLQESFPGPLQEDLGEGLQRNFRRPELGRNLPWPI